MNSGNVSVNVTLNQSFFSLFLQLISYNERLDRAYFQQIIIEEKSMIKTARKLFTLLTTEERWETFKIFLSMILMALLEVLGVASIMPFMMAVTNPTFITGNAKLSAVYGAMHFTSQQNFVFFLGATVFLLCVAGNFYTMRTTWKVLNFVNLKEYSLSRRLLQQYLQQPYIFFVNRNSSELVKNILSEINTVTTQTLLPCMDLLSKSIVTASIFLLLIFVDPFLALTLVGVFGSVYICIYFFVKTRLIQMSEELIMTNQGRFKVATEVFSSVKDVKLLHKESFFLNIFSAYAKRHATHKALADVISLTPRYALEAVSAGGIVSLVMYLLASKQSVPQTISFLALYAFACFRLMPALQQIFFGITKLRVHHKAVDLLFEDLKIVTTAAPSSNNISATKTNPTSSQLTFETALEFNKISFRYPGTDYPVINNLSLTFQKNTSIGLIGSTGSGKTTLIDLLLGLLAPTTGQLLVDGVPLDADNMLTWQNKVSYVPQQIVLVDDSVAANIAFGVHEKEIDLQKVKDVARIANIHNFVEQELAEGYNTIVGERGIRLSGGQRQRLGIARALYRDSEVLVLDEATSALDMLTEKSIMDELQQLAHKKTIVTVAHRLATVRKCDKIYMFEKGKICAEGSYDELYRNNTKFQKLADLRSIEEVKTC